MTDGVRYDTGPEGLFYHALVTHVREADKAGNIVTYRQDADGTLIKTGVIEKVDPQVCRAWGVGWLSVVWVRAVVLALLQVVASVDHPDRPRGAYRR